MHLSAENFRACAWQQVTVYIDWGGNVNALVVRRREMLEQFDYSKQSGEHFVSELL